MQLTLKQAAELAGVNKSTLFRAIKAGKVSASRDARNDAWLIEISELQRVYPLRAIPAATPAETVAESPIISATAATPDATLMQQQVDHLTETISRLESERDWLRVRLDDETTERRRLTLLLQAPLQTTPTQRGKHWLYYAGRIVLVALILAVMGAMMWARFT